MPTFRIRITNKDFESYCDANAHDPNSVRSEAIRSALSIGSDEVCGGKPFFGAEVVIENGGDAVERLVIAIGASTLR
jgi:hypothetical protein